MHPKAKKLHPHTERVYVAVTSAFDPTGYMQPKSIIWQDGQVYQIEKVSDFRPAETLGLDLSGDCYTVVINGQQKHLFFERTDPLFSSHFGRWFVEVPANSTGQCSGNADKRPDKCKEAALIDEHQKQTHDF